MVPKFELDTSIIPRQALVYRRLSDRIIELARPKTQVKKRQPTQYALVVRQTTLNKTETAPSLVDRLSKAKYQKQKYSQEIECVVKARLRRAYKASKNRIKLAQPKTTVQKPQKMQHASLVKKMAPVPKRSSNKHCQIAMYKY